MQIRKLPACTSASKKVKSAERTGEGKLPYRSNSDQTATESLKQKLVNHPDYKDIRTSDMTLERMLQHVGKQHTNL
jgi:hypothetical protein